MPSVWPLLLVAAVSGAAGAGIAYSLEHRARQAEVAVLRAEMADQQAAAAQAAAARLSAAQAAEAAAVRTLHATKSRLAVTEKRLKESLYALPTAQSYGLSYAARGLLNARLSDADDMPARASEPDRAASESPADPGQSGVTEADLGGWIAGVIGAYDACRARIEAIRQWDEVTHGR
ncbi:hypothetical protein EDC61_11950 [Sulfuritortus calidifontis]|uniref:Bacteriophage Rz lysis protein n=1 Tax=Sulfuritortus calidifontis TaxID=1914471 RepID=A0A4R3JTX9_9PROT|nr:hypothetical protein [Sulfuritortus calidifontis]TCS69750.1 hypothetical protein EDC61_11950 [Sulfuritortus calidifontis]